MATDVRTEQAEPGHPRGRRGRTWPERIALALPGAFLAVVFGFFFITKTSEAWTATKSVQAILVIAGIIGGWVLLGWLLRRFVPWVWVRSAVLSVIALAIGVFTAYHVSGVSSRSARNAFSDAVSALCAKARAVPNGSGGACDSDMSGSLSRFGLFWSGA